MSACLSNFQAFVFIVLRWAIGNNFPAEFPFSAQTFGRFSTPALGNHNVYVFIQSFIEANEKAFEEQAAPQAIADMIGIIGELFECENWESLLNKKAVKLGGTLRRSKSDADTDENITY